MSTVKEHNNQSIAVKPMKPVIFEYAYNQKPDCFDEVSYDYTDDVNKMHGKTVVDCSQANLISVTKTKVQRETDDSGNENLMLSVTKTNTQREVDDSTQEILAHATTKTFVGRESDESTTQYLLLLTKTEQAREADE